MNSLKLACINIEGDRHLERVEAFLQKENPEIVCLQEVFEKDIQGLKGTLYPYYIFAPMMKLPRDNEYLLKGVAILSKVELDSTFHEYYTGTKSLPISSTKPNSNNRVLLTATVTKENQQFTIAATHFTWSSRGRATKKQQKDLDSFLKIMEKVGECVVCGDFNVPRNGNIYKKLVQNFTDNIPKNIDSTVDPTLHKVKGLKTVVDYIFSTPPYSINSVKVIEGVSDHKALLAGIEKNI